MARQDSYRNDTTITGLDRSTGIDSVTGDTVNHLYSDVAEFVGGEFSISGNTITLPDGRTFDTGLTSLLGVSLTNLPTTEPTTAGLPWRQGQILKISGQSTDALEVVSTGAGNGIGPLVDLYRNSSSPGTSDVIGGVRLSGNNSSGVKTNYGEIRGEIGITTGNGDIVIAPSIAGTATTAVTVTGATTTINNNFVTSGTTTLGAVVTLASLPTTDPGITGRLWNDGGTPVFSGSTAAPVVSTTAAGITIDGTTTAYPTGATGTAAQSNWDATDATSSAFVQNKPRIELSGTTNVMAGGVTLNGLPTTDPSITNALWNDGGVIRVSGTSTVSTTVAELAGTQRFTGIKTFDNTVEIGTASRSRLLSFYGTRGIPVLGLQANIRANEAIGGGLDISLFSSLGRPDATALFTPDGFSLSTGNFAVADTGGVQFGAQATTTASGSTSTSKVLDDYEEGTWTPSATGVALTLVSGHNIYQKVGNTVHLHGVFDVPAGTTATTTSVSGLPFATLSSFLFVGVTSAGVVGGSQVNVGSVTALGSSLVFFPASGGTLGLNDLAGQQIIFSLTYTTTA